jgi:hypothetical protein
MRFFFFDLLTPSLRPPQSHTLRTIDTAQFQRLPFSVQPCERRLGLWRILAICNPRHASPLIHTSPAPLRTSAPLCCVVLIVLDCWPALSGSYGCHPTDSITPTCHPRVQTRFHVHARGPAMVDIQTSTAVPYLTDLHPKHTFGTIASAVCKMSETAMKHNPHECTGFFTSHLHTASQRHH